MLLLKPTDKPWICSRSKTVNHLNPSRISYLKPSKKFLFNKLKKSSKIAIFRVRNKNPIIFEKKTETISNKIILSLKKTPVTIIFIFFFQTNIIWNKWNPFSLFFLKLSSRVYKFPSVILYYEIKSKEFIWKMKWYQYCIKKIFATLDWLCFAILLKTERNVFFKRKMKSILLTWACILVTYSFTFAICDCNCLHKTHWRLLLFLWYSHYIFCPSDSCKINEINDQNENRKKLHLVKIVFKTFMEGVKNRLTRL